MKKFKILSLILFLLGIGIFQSCQSDNKNNHQVTQKEETKKQPEYKQVPYYKVVKETKQVSEQKTDYVYKYNFWKGNFYHQPNIHTVNHFIVIYTDNSHEEIAENDWLILQKGDSITKYNRIQIN